MEIFIDGDGSPIIDITIKVASRKNIRVNIVKNSAHNIQSDYAKIINVPVSKDSADFKIFNLIKKGDLLITQDQGLAALVLSKGAYCMDNIGNVIDNNNIDFLLHSRYLKSKLRREKNIYSKIKKREPHMDSLFENNLIKYLKELSE